MIQINFLTIKISNMITKKNLTQDQIQDIKKFWRNKIENSGFLIMKDKYSKKPLALAMTEDGLKYACNKMGKSLYYKSAIFKDGNIVGRDLSMSDRITIETYIPNLEETNKYFKEELLWFLKAKALTEM